MARDEKSVSPQSEFPRTKVRRRAWRQDLIDRQSHIPEAIIPPRFASHWIIAMIFRTLLIRSFLAYRFSCYSSRRHCRILPVGGCLFVLGTSIFEFEHVRRRKHQGFNVVSTKTITFKSYIILYWRTTRTTQLFLNRSLTRTFRSQLLLVSPLLLARRTASRRAARRTASSYRSIAFVHRSSVLLFFDSFSSQRREEGEVSK